MEGWMKGVRQIAVNVGQSGVRGSHTHISKE